MTPRTWLVCDQLTHEACGRSCARRCLYSLQTGQPGSAGTNGVVAVVVALGNDFVPQWSNHEKRANHDDIILLRLAPAREHEH